MSNTYFQLSVSIGAELDAESSDELVSHLCEYLLQALQSQGLPVNSVAGSRTSA
jgi:hypothetical protein